MAMCTPWVKARVGATPTDVFAANPVILCTIAHTCFGVFRW